MITNPDFDREARCGIPEVVFGENKSKEDIILIAEEHLERTGRAIITRVDEDKAAALKKNFAKEFEVKHSVRGQAMVIKLKGAAANPCGQVGILTAGTSDIPAAEEAKIILEELGCKTVTEYDAGIAGLHRIFPAIEKMKNTSVIIAIAGMEGALPTVVAGLVDVPVIGVPTSVGYGVGKGGLAALNTMLNSCTPIAVVNIDNGYGAAVLAYQIIRGRS
ncbi:MAG: hypothetical protein MSIBF_04070 [Candidatus Altiarchaeales archaeon IMC4]|nr:MAG: hypothetical protein MSIBF_04070 [Candidatus Altiarchaeales archaeon IMC4]